MSKYSIFINMNYDLIVIEIKLHCLSVETFCTATINETNTTKLRDICIAKQK